MNKQVGILTFHREYNLGAVLQAFALQHTIAGLGYRCSIIDYRRPEDAVSRLFYFPRSRRSIKHDILRLMNLQSHITSRKRFDRFRMDHFLLTAKSYLSLRDLSEGGLSFDTYVSGSDQVWHPYLFDRSCGRVFYLDFVSSGRLVAYAPSFGLTEMPAQYQDRASELIRRFDYLSAREDSGCAIIKKLTGRMVDQVLDPTLLLSADEYDKVAIEPHFEKPYILLYPMQYSDSLRDLALKIRGCLKLPIVAVLPPFFEPWRFSFADKLVYDAGPSEFLGWIKNAAFVCTNSFHGTCFSIIYRKTFLGVPHTGTGTRMHSLLLCLNLLSRHIDDPEKLTSDNPLFGSLDYSPVEPRLQQAIDASTGYLRKSLA